MTSAAAVMVAVLAIFAILSFKQMGVGLAVAILINATVIRGVLLPATMKLLGEKNWYLPSWLGWLPPCGMSPSRRRRAPRPGQTKAKRPPQAGAFACGCRFSYPGCRASVGGH